MEEQVQIEDQLTKHFPSLDLSVRTLLLDILNIAESVKAQVDKIQNNVESNLQSSPMLMPNPDTKWERETRTFKNGNHTHQIDFSKEGIILSTITRQMLFGCIEKVKERKTLEIKDSKFSVTVTKVEQTFLGLGEPKITTEKQNMIDHRDRVKMPTIRELNDIALIQLLEDFLAKIITACETNEVPTIQAEEENQEITFQK